MNNIIDYDEFVKKLEKTVYKNAKADLLNKVASNPDRYVGIFRPTQPRIKLIQNITQSHEISFGDFIEDIITQYLGNYYTNLEKRHFYNNEVILFDHLFEYDGKLFMLEQKMRDDHDSTKKRGQFENFIKKVKYINETYPNKKVGACMWFVDPSLKKNKNYYKAQMEQAISTNNELHLFYGDEFLDFLDKQSVWDEMTSYLIQWKASEDNKIELNFEKDWIDTKEELKQHVSASNWRKLLRNKDVMHEIFPILFPTGKYKEIIDEIGV